jgi:hypothetical protein
MAEPQHVAFEVNTLGARLRIWPMSNMAGLLSGFRLQASW